MRRVLSTIASNISSETDRPRAFQYTCMVCSIAYWTSTKFVQMVALGSKMALRWGVVLGSEMKYI